MKMKSLIIQLFVLAILVLAACTSKDANPVFDCSKSSLALAAPTKVDPTTCASLGSITINPTGGDVPYQFAIGTGAYSTASTFPNLGAGDYTVKVKDKSGCEKSQTVTLIAPGSTVSITSATPVNSGCGTSVGSIAVVANGSGALSYQLNTNTPVSTSTFSNLAAGTYTVKVTDAGGCSTQTAPIQILRGTKYSTDVKSIIDTNCAVPGCHVSGTGRANFTSISAVISNAAAIKSRTASGNMPQGGPKLPQPQLDLIACWVDDGAPNN
jgi:hypothetical protein